MAGWPQRLRDLRGGTVPTLPVPNFYYSTNKSSGNDAAAKGEARDWTTAVGNFQPRVGSPTGSPLRPLFKLTKEGKSPSSPLNKKPPVPLSPRQSRLRDLMAEAVEIAQTLVDADMNPELVELLTSLNRAMGMRAKEVTVEAHQPHASIQEIKRLGTSPFLFLQLCHVGAHVELLLGLAFDFAGSQSINQLQTRAGTFCPFLVGADSCHLYLCNEQSLYDISTSAVLPVVGILGHAARGWEACHVLYPANDPRFDVRTDSLRARVYYCHPLQSGSRLIGVMRFMRFDGDAVMFSLPELHMIDALAEIVAFNLHRLLQSETGGQNFSNSESDIHASKAESLLSLAKHLANAALDEKKLVAAVMQQARDLTNSDRCSLFVVQDDELEAHFEEGQTVRMQMDTGIAGYVARTGEKVEIEDAYKDSRFNKTIDLKTGYRTTSLVCLPVMYENTVVAVAQLVNKLDEQRKAIPFSKSDIELFEPFAEFVGICLRNCRLHCKLLAQERQGVLYRKVLEEITSGQSLEDGNDVCNVITAGIQGLLNCQACALYAVDFEGHEMRLESITALTDEGTVQTNAVTPLEEFVAIAQDVRWSRVELLIPNAAQHDALQHLSDVLGSLLTIPIISKDKVIGVTQVMKQDSFSAHDLEVVTSLSMFAGIALSNRHLLQFVVRANNQATDLIRMHSIQGQLPPRKSSISLVPLDSSLIMRAMFISLSPDTKALATTLQFNIFEYINAPADSDKSLELIPILVHFFEELGLIDHFRIQRHVLYRFLLRARSLYRPVPYHNFFHAVDVTHIMFYLIKFLDDVVHFDPVQKLALMVAATVHDVDHMGLNNSYHLKCDTPMGILYSSVGIDSVLEIHHCNVAFDILSQPEHNVFESLSEADNKAAHRLLVEIILATDMAHHGQLLGDFVQTCKSRKRPEEVDRVLLLKMLIKSADLSNVIRPFFLSQQWAACVTEEFYAQGDQERKHGKEVSAMFDRSKNANLAASQIGFINAVGKRHFTAIRDFCPDKLGWVMENLQVNEESWEKVKAASTA
eukprot:GGOE01003056.1.p1 GENE.GGOE01003056.1~~GGOE01003056.1.p1  ORF type:complete len:1034 (+),score=354.57 GGOE01003056.1:110-3211(+)